MLGLMLGKGRKTKGKEEKGGKGQTSHFGCCCRNCKKYGHKVADCYFPGGGAHGDKSDKKRWNDDGRRAKGEAKIGKVKGTSKHQRMDPDLSNGSSYQVRQGPPRIS